MSVISIPVVAIASVTFYAGFYHLLIYLKRWEAEDLTFALTCFLVGFYDLFSAGLYSATSVTEGAIWQRGQVVVLALASVAFLWFVDKYTSQVTRWSKWLFSVVYLVLAVVAAVDQSGLVWVDQPAIKTLHLSFGLTVTYHEIAAGPLLDVMGLLSVGLFICFLSAGIRFYRAESRQRAVPFLLSVAFFFIGVFNDSAVASGLYEFIYFMEYAYLAIVLLMTYSLTQRVVEAAIVEGELARIQALLAAAIEQSPSGILVADAPEAEIRVANAAALGIRGKNRAYLTDIDVSLHSARWQTFYPDGRPYRSEDLPLSRAILQGEVSENVEVIIRGEDGEDHWVSTNAAPVRDEEGEIVAGVVVFHDITEQKVAEQALERERDLVARIMETSPVGIGVVDRSGQIIFANPRAETILGLSREEVDGRMYNAPEWRITDYEGEPFPDERLPFQRIMSTGRPVQDVRHAIEHPDGERVYLSINAAPLFDDQGQVDGMVSSLEDVTKSVEAQEEMLRWKRLLENVTDSMPSVLITLDLAGRVLTWNPAAEELTGQTMEDVRGRLIWRACPILERYRDLVDQVLETGQRAHQLKEPMVASGGMIYYDVSVFPLIANGVDGVVLRIDDVTQRVQLEEMMLQSAKMASVGGLAAGVAHEINNPLGAMMQSAQMLHLRLDARRSLTRKRLVACGVDPDGLERYIEQRGLLDYVDGIRETGARAAKIVTDLLHFSRRSDSKIAPNDLNGLVQQVLDLAEADYDLKKKYDFRDVDLVWDLDPDLPPVLCDGQQIQQVALNLVRNAAQAMSEQKKRDEAYVPWLRLHTSQKKGWARLEVEDNGPGVPAEMSGRLFKPFFTTKSPQEGTGLGLWLSRSIVVERHKGRMRLERGERGGARFVVELPIHFDQGPGRGAVDER